MRIQTQSLHFDADVKLLDFISKKVAKLEKFHSNIVSADIILKLENPGSKVQDKIVEVIINVPGARLVAKDTSRVFEKSVDVALDSLKRQLRKHKTKVAQA